MATHIAESTLSASLRKAILRVKLPRLTVHPYKMHGSQYMRGIPDLLILMAGRQNLWCELKAQCKMEAAVKALDPFQLTVCRQLMDTTAGLFMAYGQINPDIYAADRYLGGALVCNNHLQFHASCEISAASQDDLGKQLWAALLALFCDTHQIIREQWIRELLPCSTSTLICTTTVNMIESIHGKAQIIEPGKMMLSPRRTRERKYFR